MEANRCEMTKHGKRCSAPVYCLFRKEVFEKGSIVHKHLYVCEQHASNRDRSHDTYIKTVEKDYSGESSPYWEAQEFFQFADGEMLEDPQANPDMLSDESAGRLSECDEEKLERIKEGYKLLSFREGQILNLLYYKQMTQQQIAEFLNIKQQSVQLYIKRIKNKLQKFCL